MCHPTTTSTAGPSRPAKIQLPDECYDMRTPALSPSRSASPDGYFAPRPASAALQTPQAAVYLAPSAPAYAYAPAKPITDVEAEWAGMDWADVPEDILELFVAAAQLQDGGAALRTHLANWAAACL